MTVKQRSVFLLIVPFLLCLLLSDCGSNKRERDTSDPSMPRIGILPVDTPPIGAGKPKARNMQERLYCELQRQELSQRADWAVVGPDTMGAWQKILGQYDSERTELIAGQVAGVDLVLAPRLIRHDGTYHLQLRALDTVSGKQVFCNRTRITAQKPASSLVRRLGTAISNRPERPDDPIYLTLPEPVDLQHTHEPTWRSTALRRRLRSILNEHPRIRVVNPELSRFLVETKWPDRMPVHHPPLVPGPVRDPVQLDGSLSASRSEKEKEWGTYHLDFTVRHGSESEGIRLTGKLANGPELQAKLAERILSAVNRWYDVNTAERTTEWDDLRYWAVWLILNRELGAHHELDESWSTSQDLDLDKIYERFSDLSGKEIERFLEVHNADSSAPAEPSPFQPIEESLNRFLFMGEMMVEVPENHAIQTFVQEYPTDDAIRRYLSEHMYFWDEGAEYTEAWKEMDTDLKELVLRNARYQARKALWDGKRFSKRFPFPLVHAGNGRLALDAMTSILWTQKLHRWAYFNPVLETALEQGKISLAANAYRMHETLLPKTPTKSGVKARDVSDEQIQAAKKDPNHDWESYFDQMKRNQEKDEFQDKTKWADPEKYRTFVDPVDVSLRSRTYEPDKKTFVTVTGQGEDLWGIVQDDEGQCYLWTPDAETSTQINGLPEMEPPSTDERTYTVPSMVSYRGSLYVALGADGLWKVDTLTGLAIRVTKGLPKNAHVHVVNRYHKSIYAGGVTTTGRSSGFLVRLTPNTAPKRFTPPEGAGGIRYMDATAGTSWRFYHHLTGRVTRFEPDIGQWTSSYRVETDAFSPSIFAATDTVALFAERAHTPMYTIRDPSDHEMQPVYYPPPDSDDSSYHLRQHEWFLTGDKHVRSSAHAPLSDTPVDAIGQGQRILLLDRSGGLVITDRATRFSSPVQVQNARGLQEAGDRLLVVGTNSLQVIHYDKLNAHFGNQNQWVPSEKLFKQTKRHIRNWLEQQSVWKRSAYYRRLGNPARAAEEILDAPDVTRDKWSVGWAALLLEKAGRTERASDVLNKHGLAANGPAEIPENRFHFTRLQALQQWEKIRSDIRLIWKRRPDLYARDVYKADLDHAYVEALEEVMNQRSFLKRMWSILYGELPEVQNGWEQNNHMRIHANRLRTAAAEQLIWHLTTQQRYQTIIQHPLLGPHNWNESSVGRDWHLYLYTNQPQRAIRTAKFDDERTRAYLYSGQYEKAAKRNPDERSESLEPYLKANLLAGNMETVKAVKQRAVDRDRPGIRQFAERLLLLHRSPAPPGAFVSWRTAFKAEFYQHREKALTAYRKTMTKFPDTLPAAESAFRLGELMTLDRDRPSKATRYFNTARSQYKTLLDQSNHFPTKTYARYRLGQIAYLVTDNRDAAEQYWSRGKQGMGPGRILCRQAFQSISPNQPSIRVGAEKHPDRQRIVTVNLSSERLHTRLKKPYSNNYIRGIVRAPIGAPNSLFDWGDSISDSWSVHLHYRFNDLRPGFTMIHVQTPDDRDTVWCRLQQK